MYMSHPEEAREMTGQKPNESKVVRLEEGE
jgi:hypothetical protein